MLPYRLMVDPTRDIILAGPTASGKTALAVALAQQYNTVVVNADSMQVYSDLQYLNARPDLQEMQGVPHFLFGHVDGTESYSVGRWLQEVAALREDYPKTRMVFCGGTGLYLKALVEGFTDTPMISAKIRAQVAGDYAQMAHEDFVADLIEREPEAFAHLEQVPDYQRTIRAAEVIYATDKPLIYWHREHHIRPLLPDAYQIALVPERAKLYERIDARCAQILPRALEEVSALCQRNLRQNQSIMRCIGVTTLTQFLSGDLSEAATLEFLSRDTRRYAKRQMTWLKHQMRPDCVESEFGAAIAVEKFADSGLGMLSLS